VAASMSNEIEDAIYGFLADWDRHEWMIDHGEWASAEWEDARNDYDAALAELRAVVDAADDADGVSDDSDCDAIAQALDDLRECAKALDSQVLPDESDYIEEGTIDPDGVADKAVCVYDGGSHRGWDCAESIDGYRVGDALYMRWRRDAYGNSNRHSRDLWVLVSDDFFIIIAQ
jgi:hypothetical protein